VPIRRYSHHDCHVNFAPSPKSQRNASEHPLERILSFNIPYPLLYYTVYNSGLSPRLRAPSNILEITPTAPGNPVRSQKLPNQRETAAVENSSVFWPFLDSLSSSKHGVYETEKEYYENIRRLLHDEFLVEPVTLSSFELGLALRTAAPKIEAYYQFYNTSVVPSLETYYDLCETWIHWRGEQICSPDNLEAKLRQPTTTEWYLLKSW
jgi:Thioredoxin-like domain